jgi:hypothetical protein
MGTRAMLPTSVGQRTRITMKDLPKTPARVVHFAMPIAHAIASTLETMARMTRPHAGTVMYYCTALNLYCTGLHCTALVLYCTVLHCTAHTIHMISITTMLTTMLRPCYHAHNHATTMLPCSCRAPLLHCSICRLHQNTGDHLATSGAGYAAYTEATTATHARSREAATAAYEEQAARVQAAEYYGDPQVVVIVLPQVVSHPRSGYMYAAYHPCTVNICMQHTTPEGKPPRK